MIEHRLTVQSVCPVNGDADTYSCVIRTEDFLPVEEILAAVAEATEEPAFQEDITRAVAALLATEVETRGHHSGVYTTCRFNGARS